MRSRFSSQLTETVFCGKQHWRFNTKPCKYEPSGNKQLLCSEKGNTRWVSTSFFVCHGAMQQWCRKTVVMWVGDDARCDSTMVAWSFKHKSSGNNNWKEAELWCQAKLNVRKVLYSTLGSLLRSTPVVHNTVIVALVACASTHRV